MEMTREKAEMLVSTPFAPYLERKEAQEFLDSLENEFSGLECSSCGECIEGESETLQAYELCGSCFE